MKPQEITTRILDGLDTDDWDDWLDGQLPEGVDGEWLWLAAAHLTAARQSLQAAETALAALRLADVRENGPVRFADTFITAGPKTTRRVDTDGLVGWADATAQALGTSNLVPELWRLDAKNLRVTTLRELAARLYRHMEPDDTDGVDDFTKLIESTFVTTMKEDEAVLKEIPIDKAPKYAQALDHGHRAGSYKNKEKKT